jgi:hypothetical protein
MLGSFGDSGWIYAGDADACAVRRCGSQGTGCGAHSGASDNSFGRDRSIAEQGIIGGQGASIRIKTGAACHAIDIRRAVDIRNARHAWRANW